MPKRTIFFLLWWGNFFSVSFAEQKFPFLAEVNTDGVYVRAGQHTNFETVCRLNRGAQLVVVARSYSWYKVKLPREAKSYISQEYAQMMNSDTALILKDRVNIRADTGTQFTVLGQLNKGITVKVLEKLKGWYRIEPVEGTYGWIADQLLTFKSDQLLLTALSQSGSGTAEMAKLFPQSTVISLQDVSSHLSASLTGRVENLKEAIPQEEIDHQLIMDDGTIYHLQGPPRVIGEFVGYRVNVQGKPLDDSMHLYPHPVIAISRIDLVL